MGLFFWSMTNCRIAVQATVYLRVSTLDQTTANQERELRPISERICCNIVKVYRDHGVSGTKGRGCGTPMPVVRSPSWFFPALACIVECRQAIGALTLLSKSAVSERGVLSAVRRAVELRFAAKPKIRFARIAGRPPAGLRAKVY
jgi:hypothetical protein